MHLSIVIPAYNEEQRLPGTLDIVLPYMHELGRSFEVVIQDDGSKDGTARVVHEYIDRGEPLRLLGDGVNRGKGYAIKMGMLAAKGDIVVFMDADLSTPIQELKPFLVQFDAGFDVVVGTRKFHGANVKVHQPPLRENMGKVFTMLSNLLLRTNYSDFTCGFKGFRKHVIQAIFKPQRIFNWSYDAEIMFILRKRGIRWTQVPVTWSDDPRTRVKLVGDSISSFLGLLRILFNDLCRCYG